MNTMTKSLLVLATAASVSMAQEPASQEPLNIPAIVKLKIERKPQSVKVLAAEGKNAFRYDTPEGPMILKIKDCDTFLMRTPDDLAQALLEYQGDRLESARTKLGQVKRKYAMMVGLPDNAASTAANLELDCAVRLQDWAAVKTLADKFPGKTDLGEGMPLRLETAKLLGLLSQENFADALLEQAKPLLENKNKLTLEELGWLQYALGRAYAAKIPVAELEAGRLSDESVPLANQAIDAYSMATVATYGGKLQLPADAARRAAALLFAMPEAQAAVARIGKLRNEATLKKNPVSLKDAAAMATIYQTLLKPGDKDEQMTRIASYFVNDAKVEKKAEQKSAKPAAAKPAAK